MKKRHLKVYIILLVLFCLAAVSAYTLKDHKKSISAIDFISQDKSPVRLLGRYSADENDTIWFDYTLSGMEFTFSGRKCVVHFSSDFLAEDETHAVIGVFVNDFESEKLRLEIDRSACDYTVFESDVDEEAVIRIVKLSEAKQGTVGISGMTVYGKAPTVKRTEDKDRLFQFVGDSITCGMGNETAEGEGFSTLKENGNMTYGAITARKFDADVEFVSYSGIGLIWGTSADIPPMPTLYQYSGYSRGNREATEWNPVRKPDVICINLGTNDSKHIKDDVDLTLSFKEKYIDFLKSVRYNNPEAYLLVCYGPMKYDFEETVRLTMEEYQAETGDNRSGYLSFDQSLKVGSGCGGHPTVKTHENMAEKLEEYLERQL